MAITKVAFRSTAIHDFELSNGGDLGGPVDDTIFPSKFEIDYVRVYQNKH